MKTIDYKLNTSARTVVLNLETDLIARLNKQARKLKISFSALVSKLISEANKKNRGSS